MANRAKLESVKKLSGMPKSKIKIRERPSIHDPGRPDAPRYIEGRQAYFYGLICDELDKLGALGPAFREIITTLSIRLAEVEEYTIFIRENGRTFQTENIGGGVMHRAYPQAAMLNEALRHTQSLLSEIGLTPTAIGRLGAMRDKKDKGDGWGDL